MPESGGGGTVAPALCPGPRFGGCIRTAPGSDRRKDTERQELPAVRIGRRGAGMRPGKDVPAGRLSLARRIRAASGAPGGQDGCAPERIIFLPVSEPLHDTQSAISGSAAAISRMNSRMARPSGYILRCPVRNGERAPSGSIGQARGKMEGENGGETFTKCQICIILKPEYFQESTGFFPGRRRPGAERVDSG